MACGHQFRASRERPEETELWRLYQSNKQTVAEIAQRYGVSPSTIKRILRQVKCEWVQPVLTGGGFVHMDGTYQGRGNGILLAIDHDSGKPLYLEFVTNETNAHYQEALRSIECRGYQVRGIIIDGRRSLFQLFEGYPIQMCQFHMRQIVRRYLTLHPRLLAARELNELMKDLVLMTESEFNQHYTQWKQRWDSTIKRRSVSKTTGKSRYTHRRLRTAMNSIDFYRPYLFTYQRPDCAGMPNTNNKIEGIFTDLKKNLNTHSGMNEQSRRRFISGFFLASDGDPQVK